MLYEEKICLFQPPIATCSLQLTKSICIKKLLQSPIHSFWMATLPNQQRKPVVDNQNDLFMHLTGIR